MSSPREAWRQARAHITGMEQEAIKHQILCGCLTVCEEDDLYDTYCGFV